MKKNALLIAAISGLLVVTACGNKAPSSTPAKAEKTCTCSEAKASGTEAKKECTCGANGCGANGCGAATTPAK